MGEMLYLDKNIMTKAKIDDISYNRIYGINMRNEYCKSCPRDKRSRKNGICTRKSPDGFPVRCGPLWTLTKHKFIEGYCEIFTKAMKNKFQNMYFIDLFAGPGLYYHWPSGDLLEGSPLIASKYYFRKYYLNDIDEANIQALQFRLKDRNIEVEFITSDANRAGEAINTQLPINSLSLCFVDPDNMKQLKYSTLKSLVRSRKVDLLINFPYDMAFKRGAKNIYNNYRSGNAIDEFLGTPEWIDIFRDYQCRFSSEFCLEIIRLYSKQFYKLGYCEPKDKQGNIEIIKRSKNKAMYFLLFLCKNPLGYRFWREMIRYVKEIDLKLDF